MLFPRKLALTLCAVSGMLVGAATIAQAGPATGLIQAAPAVAATSTLDMPQVQKAYWHHWHYHYWRRHYWHHHYWHHHWRHWHHW